MAIPNRNHSNSDNRCTGVSLTSHHLSSLKGTLGNKFPESLIRIDYPRYCCYYSTSTALARWKDSILF